MSNLVKAGLYSALFTISGGSLYYLFSLVMALASGGDIVQVLIDTLIGSLVCWVIGSFFFYEIGKAFDEFNKSGKKPNNDDHSGC